jgi:hypothetical protein
MMAINSQWIIYVRAIYIQYIVWENKQKGDNMGYEKKTFRQIWKDVKCALGIHSLYTWNVDMPYRHTQITECYNCRYKKEEHVEDRSNFRRRYRLGMDEDLREIKKVEI